MRFHSIEILDFAICTDAAKPESFVEVEPFQLISVPEASPARAGNRLAPPDRHHRAALNLPINQFTLFAIFGLLLLRKLELIETDSSQMV